MSYTQATTESGTMNHETIYEALLGRGFHEDFLDEAPIEMLVKLYESGCRRDQD